MKTFKENGGISQQRPSLFPFLTGEELALNLLILQILTELFAFEPPTPRFQDQNSTSCNFFEFF